MFTSHSGVLALISLAGLGVILVLVGLFSYGSRHLRLVAEAEQYLASTTPVALIEATTTGTLFDSVSTTSDGR